MKDGEKTLFKGFEILELIGRSRNGLKGKEVAESLGIPLSTAFRQLKFMTERGFLRHTTGRYALGAVLIRLGNEAVRQNPLSQLARPKLTELADRTAETVHLAELRGDLVVYVDKVEGRRSVRMGSMIGNCSPLHCTGVGKAILAFLPEEERGQLMNKLPLNRYTSKTITTPSAFKREITAIKRRGYAVDNCEHEPGVFCVAAPVLDAGGYPVGAISVSGAEAYLREQARQLAEHVTETASEISAELA